jgi:hypothetical protein
MTYTVKSHSDADRNFIIDHRGYSIIINYPEDIDTFDQLQEENIDVLVSGYIASHAELPDYSEPESSSSSIPSTSPEWF